MAISEYVHPHLEISQQLEVVEQATSGELAACVVGAQYALYRYGQEELTPNAFNAKGETITFTFEQQAGYAYEVDLDSVAMNAEGLEASLATFTNTFELDSRNIMGIRTSDGTLIASADNKGIANNLQGLSVNIGDVAYITVGGSVRRRAVTGLLGKMNAAKIENGESSNTGIVLGTTVKINSDAAYTGTKDTTYVVEVQKVGTATSWKDVELKVTDTSGVDTADFINLTAATVNGQAIGTKGLKLDFAANPSNLAVGDTFSIICIAATESTTEFDGVVFEAMPVDMSSFERSATIDSVEFRKVFSGEIPSTNVPLTSWTATAAGVEVAAGLALYIEDRNEPYINFVDGVGSLYVSYRVLVSSLSVDESTVYIDSTEAIQENFGTIAPENELAFGCACALEGAAGKAIYALRTTGTSADAFLEAVKKTESDSSVYAFAVITEDKEVMDVVAKYNIAQSQPDVMMWRRTLVGVDAPGAYKVASLDGNNNLLKATISANTDGKFTLLQVSEDNDFSFLSIDVNGADSQIHKGDQIQILTNGAMYTIAAILSAKEVLLETGPATGQSVATPIAVWKADTPENASEYVTSIAKSYNNRRVIVVWCDKGIQTGTNTPLDNKFLAAEIAGLTSAVVPQQGVTRFEIVSINKAPRMYTQYSQKALDDIAKEGVLIVTQNTKGGACYIRHQLTTETDKGNLYYEDSCTRNIDNISYAMKSVLDKYIGKANVTPTALMRIRLDSEETLDGFLNDSPDDLIGPSLVSWDNLSVRQDSKFKDRVIIRVNLYIPLPINGIRLFEMAYIADLTITEAAA